MEKKQPELTLGKVVGVFVVLVIAAALGAGLIVYVKHEARLEAAAQFQSQAAPVKLPPRPLPEFALTNQDGEAVSKDSLKGKVWLANFIFSTCPGQCIVLTNQFKDFQAEIKEMPDVELVSFSVDPEHDTPEVLRTFGEQYQAGPQWKFLTGSKDDIYRLLQKGFLLDAAPNPDPEQVATGEKILHTTKVVLVDGEGQIRNYYDGLPVDLYPQVLQDIRTLRSQP